MPADVLPSSAKGDLQDFRKSLCVADMEGPSAPSPSGTRAPSTARSSKGPSASGSWGVVEGPSGAKASTPGAPRDDRSAYPQIRARSSFIELTAIAIALGALAIIIVPQFLRIKDNAHLATVRSDLRSLVSAEESYYSDYHTYTTVLPAARYVPSPGVTYVVDVADETGWRASASSKILARGHSSVASCHVAVGSAVKDGETEADPLCP